MENRLRGEPDVEEGLLVGLVTLAPLDCKPERVTVEPSRLLDAILGYPEVDMIDMAGVHTGVKTGRSKAVRPVPNGYAPWATRGWT